MERTTEVDDNFQVMRELEELRRGGSTWANLGLRLLEEEEILEKMGIGESQTR